MTLWAGDALSATLEISGGELIGATGVVVGSGVYSVDFQDQSCIAAYSGCNEISDFPFVNQTEAEAAGQALIEQVFTDGPLGNFLSSPNLIRGCQDPNACLVFIPFQALPQPGLYAFSRAGYARDSSGMFASRVDSRSGARAVSDLRGLTSFTMADFEQIGTVPVPPALALLLSGIAGLWIVRARSK